MIEPTFERVTYMCPLFKSKGGNLFYETSLGKNSILLKVGATTKRLGYEVGPTIKQLGYVPGCCEYVKGKDGIVIQFDDNKFNIQYQGKGAYEDAIELSRVLDGKPVSVYQLKGMSSWICCICKEEAGKLVFFDSKEETLNHVEKMHPNK